MSSPKIYAKALLSLIASQDDRFALIRTHNLYLKKPEPLEAARRKATGDPFAIYHFYDMLEVRGTGYPVKFKG